MDVGTVNNLPPPATHDDAVRCLMTSAVAIYFRAGAIAGTSPRGHHRSRTLTDDRQGQP
jgi:hypothetical protein